MYEEPAGSTTQTDKVQRRSGRTKTLLGQHQHQQHQAGGQGAEAEPQGAALPGPRRARAAARRLLQQDGGTEGAELPKPNFVVRSVVTVRTDLVSVGTGKQFVIAHVRNECT